MHAQEMVAAAVRCADPDYRVAIATLIASLVAAATSVYAALKVQRTAHTHRKKLAVFEDLLQKKMTRSTSRVTILSNLLDAVRQADMAAKDLVNASLHGDGHAEPERLLSETASALQRISGFFSKIEDSKTLWLTKAELSELFGIRDGLSKLFLALDPDNMDPDHENNLLEIIAQIRMHAHEFQEMAHSQVHDDADVSDEASETGSPSAQ